MKMKYFKIQTKRKQVEFGGHPITISTSAIKDSLIDFSVDSDNGFAYGVLSIKEARQLISILQDAIKEAVKN